MKHIAFWTLGVGMLLAGIQLSPDLLSKNKRNSYRAENSYIVLELFTSQGCSSCPPAEDLLRTLSRSDRHGANLIPLRFHVDYWNYLGWKDPYSRAEWSDRQSEYRDALGGSTLYTPQLVVQGQFEMVGSDERRIRQALEELSGRFAEDRGQVMIDRAYYDSQGIHIDVHTRFETPGEESLFLVAAAFEEIPATRVPRGENAGRTLKNDFVVRDLEANRLSRRQDGRKKGEHTLTISLDNEWAPERMGIAVWLQEEHSMRISGADVKRNLSKK